MAFDSADYCAFCNMPGAKHEGGAAVNGVHVSGRFCGKPCFEKWLRWKGALLTFSKPVAFPQPNQKDGQTVFQ